MKNLKDEVNNLKNLLENVQKNVVTTTEINPQNTTTTTTNTSSQDTDKSIQKPKDDEKTLKMYEDKLKELKEREEKFLVIDNEISNLIDHQDSNINLNVGGEIFHTKLSTILSEKDTLLYKLIAHKIQKKLKLEETIFIDRNPELFKTILNYLRTKKFSTSFYTNTELEDLKNESEYFGIIPIYDKIADFEKEVIIVSFEASPQYSNVGTYNLTDINDRTMMKGFALQSPYHIIFQLNHETDLNAIEIGGYNGNTGSWAPSNGSGAKILTSTNKTTWTEVGTIPANYASSVVRVPLKQSTALYLKFQHNTYLGIGFLKVVK